MSTWEDWTHSLTVLLNHSILGTCSFLDEKFRYMPISAISICRGSNLLSECMRVILNPHFSYSLLTCLIISSILFIFRLIIILPFENRMCWHMVLSDSMPFMWMRSLHRVNSLYLSKIPLGGFGIMIGSIRWILWQTILPFKCGTLGP